MLRLLCGVGGGLVAVACLAADSWEQADWSGAELEFKSDTTITGGKASGTGIITIDGCKVSDNTKFGEDFTGTLVLTNGGRLAWTGGGNPVANPFTAAAKIVLGDGELYERSDAVNMTVTNDIEIVENAAVTNLIYSYKANMDLKGRLTGAGTVLLQTWDRGIRLYGDNSGFSGTAIFDPQGGGWNAHGLHKACAGSANATFTLLGAKNYSVDGWTFALQLLEGTESDPMHLGAFNVLDPQALVMTVDNNSWKGNVGRSYLIIGEKNEDCVIEGGFNRAPVTITKAGTAALTLGTNFSCVAESKLIVESGTLVVNGACPDLKIEVGSGAVLTGSGQAYVTKLAPGCTVTGEVDVVFAGGQEKLTYDMDAIPFVDHVGSVIITNGTTVIWDGSSFKENKSTSVFGSSPKLVLAGGCLRGFWKSNNQALHGEIRVLDNTVNAVTNNAANSMSGVNLEVRAVHHGNGRLEYYQKDRWIKFFADNAAFAGEVIVSGASSAADEVSDDWNATWFPDAGTGFARGSFTHDRAAWLKLDHASNTTNAFGALNVTANTRQIFVKNANTTLEIGANNGDSVIEPAFTGQPFVLRKVGSGLLTFGAVVEGTSVIVSADAVEVAKLDPAQEDYPLVTVPNSVPSSIDPAANRIAVTEGASKGEWVVQALAGEAGVAYRLHWQPRGLRIIIR
ncbi:MAG: hypothetical protein ACI4RD_05430 [Kiritimatiellia bacterium]